MRSEWKGMTFEEMAIERNRELERQRAAAEPPEPSGYQYPPDETRPTFMVSEAAALPWGACARRSGEYSSGVQHMLRRVWHVIYTMSDRQLEIVRLRENTRQVLARLATA